MTGITGNNIYKNNVNITVVNRKSVRKTSINVNLYGKMVIGTHKKFLEKTDHRGLTNPSRTHNEILTKLAKNYRYVYEVMQKTKNLNKDNLYEIFNASTLESFLKSLIRDPSIDAHRYKYNQYDFRTSEIVRLNFEIISDYLVNSPNFKGNENIEKQIKELREHFKSLSNSMLDKEDKYASMSKEKQDKIIEKIEKLSPAEDLVNVHEYNYKKIKQNLDEKRNEFIDVESAIIICKESKSSKSLKKQIKEMEENLSEITKDIFTYRDKLEDEIKKREEIRELQYQLNQRYKHLANYACTIETLDDMKDSVVVEELKSMSEKIKHSKTDEDYFSKLTPDQFHKFVRISEQMLDND